MTTTATKPAKLIQDTLVVSVNRKVKDMPLKLAYDLNGETYYISRDNRLHIMKKYEYDAIVLGKDQTKAKALNVVKLKFESGTKTKPGRLSYIYKVNVDKNGDIIGMDAEGTVINPDKITGDQAYGIFFMKFPDKNLLSIILQGKSKKAQTSNTKEKTKILNLILEMSEEKDGLTKLRNVASLYGIPSTGKSVEELFTILADFKTGAAFANDINIKLFNETYVTKTNKDADLVILINRAIELVVIRVERKADSTRYLFKDMQLGYDKVDVRESLKKDTTLKNSVELAVRMKAEEGGEGAETEILDPASKTAEAEEMRTMREALLPFIKTDENPDGPIDIGKKAITIVSKEDIRAYYKQYVLKEKQE